MRWGVVLRGLWWRRGFTVAVLAVAAVTTAAAALGPLYARAAAESTLRDQLNAAPSSSTGLHYSAVGDVTTSLAQQQLLAPAPRPGAVAGYPSRIVGLVAGTQVRSVTGAVVNSGVLWRQGMCDHVIVLSGHCPSRPGEALASQRTFGSTYGWQLGGTLTLTGLQTQGTDVNGFPVYQPAHVRIVGSYRPRDTTDPYWFGRNYFDAHASIVGRGPDEVDTLLVSASEWTSLAPPQSAELDVDLPIRPRAVSWATVGSVRRDVQRLEQQVQARAAGATEAGQGANPLQTRVLSVLAAAAHQRALVGTGTTLVTLQLGLLAWLVLFQVVSEAAEARGNEIALAKVRGRRALATLLFGLSEPLLLLLAAVPLGIGIALVATHVFASGVLAGGIDVVLPRGALLAALVAFAGGVVAAGLAAYRTLTRSVLDQWQRATRSARSGRMALLADVSVAAAALIALVVLRRRAGGRADGSLTLLAPGLLVAAIGLVGVRLLPVLCRLLSRPTRASRWLGLALAVRQVGRRPSGLRLATLLAIAVGLATFAVAGEAVARGNRNARAAAEVGAQRVVSVQYSVSHDPVAAVARADPQGRWAMAAATWLPDGGGSVAGEVLAVDSRRLAAVGAAVRGGPSLAEVARTIGRAVAPAVTIRSQQVRLRITAGGLSGGPEPNVVLRLRTRSDPLLSVFGAALRPGTADYVIRVPCAAGCGLDGMYWERPIDAADTQHGTVTVRGIDIGEGQHWKALPVLLTRPGAWRAAVAQGMAADTVQATPSGMQDRFVSHDGGFGGVDYADSPSPMPAVATHEAITRGSGAPDPRVIADASPTVRTFTVEHWARVLPVVLEDGVLLDVRFLEAQLPAFAEEATWQVWLGPRAPAGAVARLRAAGLIVQGERTVAARLAVLGRQGPALALLLLLACAIAGSVLAVGGTAISISANSRRRSYELAALRAVDVPRRTLTRSAVVEQLLLLGTAVVLGVPGGVLAAVLSLPAIPEFADHTPVPQRYGLAPAPVTVFVLGFVVLLVGTAVVAAVNLLRVAVPSRLREGAA